MPPNVPKLIPKPELHISSAKSLMKIENSVVKKKKDFDIQISDDLNASIFCSGRFYEAVVMPAVASIGEIYTQKVSGVCLTC